MRSVFLSKFPIFADSIEQLPTSGELRNKVEFVLSCHGEIRSVGTQRKPTYLGFEPVDEVDNVRVVESLQHFELIVDHLFITPDILLQDDFDGNLLSAGFRLADNAIGAST